MKKTVKKKCEGCGNIYNVCFYERNRQRFCEPACAYKYAISKTVDKDTSNNILFQYNEKLKSLCDTVLIVGVKYHTVRKVLLQNNVKIRSNAEQQKINFRHNPDRHVGSSSAIKCSICRDQFHRWDSQINRHKNKRNFCSKECADIDRTFRDCILRYGKGWSVAKKLARQRDKVCQICKKNIRQNGRNMDVHHIYPMRFFIEDKKSAHKLSNLVCLCRSCHKKVDARGRKYERLLQFDKQQGSIDKIWKRAFEEIQNHTPVFCGE